MSALIPETVLSEILAAFPGARVELVSNPGPSAQHALLLRHDHPEGPAEVRAIAAFLRDQMGLDYASNVSGVDHPDCLEAVYHLYSIAKKQGPITLKMRTGDRVKNVTVPSLTPVWKSAEFQEREAFDLFGIRFEGHPDLRRLLMWEEFTDYPLRKDYVAPDDYEYEPTPHGAVLEKAKAAVAAASTTAPASPVASAVTAS